MTAATIPRDRCPACGGDLPANLAPHCHGRRCGWGRHTHPDCGATVDPRRGTHSTSRADR